MISKVFTAIKEMFSRDDGDATRVNAGSDYYSRISNAACKQCLDTGKIVRGHDGQKISCPNCR